MKSTHLNVTRIRFAVFLLSTGLAAGCGSGAATSEAAEFSSDVVTVSATPPPLNTSKHNADGVITIAAVGDIMLGSTSINETFLPPNDGKDVLREVTPLLASADIAFGNLEGPLIDGGVSTKCPPGPKAKPAGMPTPTPTPTPKPKTGEKKKPIGCFAFRTPTHYGKYLKEAGFDVLSLANNHSLDFGIEGIASTRRTLDALAIEHVGSDRLRYASATVESNGKKIAFVGFAHNTVVPNINDLSAAGALVAKVKRSADIVVVSFHGGSEGAAAEHVPFGTEMLGKEKRGNLRAFARTIIDAGADLVLGHGPHVLRGMESYKDRLVIYSMGNFATYGMFNLKGAQGLTAIFEIKLDTEGKFVGGKIHSAKQVGRGIPVLEDSGESIKKIRALSLEDFGKTAPTVGNDGVILLN
ncbi:MAG: CapA family protein [Pyrinomonadaceae bacterium]